MGKEGNAYSQRGVQLLELKEGDCTKGGGGVHSFIVIEGRFVAADWTAKVVVVSIRTVA